MVHLQASEMKDRFSEGNNLDNQSSDSVAKDCRINSEDLLDVSLDSDSELPDYSKPGRRGPPDKDSNTMKFDSLFPIIGEFGHYQKRVYFLLCLPAICCAMHKLAWVFLGAKLDIRCKLPIEGDNATYSELPYEIFSNMTYPRPSDKNSKAAWDSCTRLDVNFSDPTYFESGIPATETVGCDGKYVYDFSQYQSSARVDYDLYCDRNWLYTTAQNLFMVGIMLGSIVFGDLSDRFGRRPIFFLSLVLQVVFGVLAAWAPDYWTFVIARMVVGSSTSGIFLVGYVIAMEMVGPSRRTFVGVCCQLFFTAGYLVTGTFAYLIRDWQMLQLALSVPGLVFLSYYWFLPESVRWLLARGRREEAKAILKNVAIENKVTISDEVYESLSADTSGEKSSTSIWQIFRYRRLSLRSINIFFNWFVNSGVYYGLSLNTSNIGGNHYINFTIAGAVEVPAYLFILISLQRFGRKVVLCGCMLAGGLFMVACGLLPDDADWNVVLISFAMIGKMCITASYGVIYIFTAESFPTVVRNGGVGASSMFARVGGIVANSLLFLGDYWRPLPLLIFGGASLIAGFLALLIPETFGKQLPETLEDGEKFGTDEYKDSDLKDLGSEEQRKS